MIADRLRRAPQRIVGEMCVTLGSHWRRVSEQATDDRQSETSRGTGAGMRMPEVMKANIAERGSRAYMFPWALQIVS